MKLRGKTINGNTVEFEFIDLGVNPWEGKLVPVMTSQFVIGGASHFNHVPGNYTQAERVASDIQFMRSFGFVAVMEGKSFIFTDEGAIEALSA